ncbi:MAG: inositol monophosphatase [Oculatellaceae cyanobacterium Prado106]|nr:inositol monophosphatase [Oculatellaceae cyanobacterium Prado106]
MQPQLETYLNIASEAAIAGGIILKAYQGHLRDIRSKSEHPGDLVTEADRAADAAVIEVLQRHVPDHSILTEESGRQDGSSAKYLWAIDPLDGTTNYVHRYPFFATSVALLINEVPQVGAIYDPTHDELFLAATGMGATCNRRPIRVSSTKALEQSFLGTYLGFDQPERMGERLQRVTHLMGHTQGIRQLGSSAMDLAYVACGRSDGYWQWQGLSVWDVAAGVVLVREAGGRVTSCQGGVYHAISSEQILATNGQIHDALLAALQV